jgi:LysR family hydrogen peroxide-inducible transcriptional activator
MTIRDLSYLVALADKKNFARAAEACHVGQPMLSVQLKKLEDYLGVTLFERDNHHVSPTPIGEEVIERARIALKAVGEIRELARQARDPMDGTVRLGVIPTLALFPLPPLLPALKQCYPKLVLVLREDLGGVRSKGSATLSWTLWSSRSRWGTGPSNPCPCSGSP